jgi:hypothetical protein
MTARPSATVIEFPQDRVRPACPEGGPSAAEVLFFTGVRIERLAEEPDAMPEPGSGGRRQRR